jgi:hypothetical protein
MYTSDELKANRDYYVGNDNARDRLLPLRGAKCIFTNWSQSLLSGAVPRLISWSHGGVDDDRHGSSPCVRGALGCQVVRHEAAKDVDVPTPGTERTSPLAAFKLARRASTMVGSSSGGNKASPNDLGGSFHNTGTVRLLWGDEIPPHEDQRGH